jgi:hypothetical protein
MLDSYVHHFAEATVNLAELKNLLKDLEGKNKNANGVTHLSKEVKRRIGLALENLRSACVRSDIEEAIPPIDRLVRSLSSPFTSEGDITTEIRHLINGMWDRLKTEYYFHVSLRDVDLYNTSDLFGPIVARKMPATAEDIEEAGKCLALSRHTACVFHLMRVMELGVHVLAKKLKVRSVNPAVDSWDRIAGQVNVAINALPARTARQKARKESLGAASAHLNSVRIAWRNPTMHPKKTYTYDQARDVFNASRAFMDHLAGLL